VGEVWGDVGLCGVVAGGEIMSAMGAVVRTRNGQLRGRIADGVHAFVGVPYAAPPFGARRLLPPRPVAPWGGVREAGAFGAEVPQLHPADPGVW
jgi:para-nitrobenzyl esterase